MTDEVQFNLGRHEAALEALTKELHAVRSDMAQVMALMSEIRGGAKVGLKVIAGVGAISSGLTLVVEKVVSFLHGNL